MKKSIYVFFLLFSPIFASANNFPSSSNLYLELKEISEHEWGVFVNHDNTIKENDLLHTGSGQITLVAPAGFTYYQFKNHGGTWVENAKVTSPSEAKGRCYISFGFVMDHPKIQLITHEATLLFSFKTDPIYFGHFQLFENDVDPFDTPNSFGTNPGNDLGMMAKTDAQEIKYLLYAHNIAQPAMNIYSEAVNEDEN